LNTNKVLFNKLNDYFKDNIRISLKCGPILLIVTKDLFYCIDIENANIPYFIINDDNSVIQSLIIQELCQKQINDIKINYLYRYCFARNEHNIYYYDIPYGVMKEYFSQEKIIDMCCGFEHSILLTLKCPKWWKMSTADTFLIIFIKQLNEFVRNFYNFIPY
jgi:hypothetical protein